MIWLIMSSICVLLLFVLNNEGVPIWLFHQVNSNSNTSPKALDGFFAYLSRQGYQTHTLKEIDALRKANQKLPKKSLILTFDDGYYDNYSIVYPLLKKHNLKAIFFVNTLFIKELTSRTLQTIEKSDFVNAELIDNYFNQQDATSDQYITWEEIREMEASGHVDIQCHSHRHGMVFSNLECKQVVQPSFISAGDYFVHQGNVQTDFPLFKMRGELSAQGYKINQAGSVLFKEFFQKINLVDLSKKELAKKTKQFLTKDFKNKYIQAYTEREFKERVEKEIGDNTFYIESRLLNKKAIGFAWPYGHQTKVSMPWMKALGMHYFFTCKKGTNARTLNSDFIYRMELRKVTLERLIFLTEINSNFALGWLYRWLS